LYKQPQKKKSEGWQSQLIHHGFRHNCSGQRNGCFSNPTDNFFLYSRVW